MQNKDDREGLSKKREKLWLYIKDFDIYHKKDFDMDVR